MKPITILVFEDWSPEKRALEEITCFFKEKISSLRVRSVNYSETALSMVKNTSEGVELVVIPNDFLPPTADKNFTENIRRIAAYGTNIIFTPGGTWRRRPILRKSLIERLGFEEGIPFYLSGREYMLSLCFRLIEIAIKRREELGITV